MIPFYFVDVFASKPLAGNPVCVVPDAGDLSDSTMKALAREFNQSATTFLLQPAMDGADRRLRSFTPAGAEVGGAGHNALGAWWWLSDSGRLALHETETWFTQEIGGRLLPLRIIADNGRVVRIGMRQAPLELGTSVRDIASLGSALGLRARDFDERVASQVAGTGVAHLLVAVRSRALLNGVTPSHERLREILAEAGAEGCYVFSLADEAGSDIDAYARFFNPTVGISEDAATGTAAGPLACVLAAMNLATGARVTIEQGERMQRPSRIEVSISDGVPEIRGSAVVSGRGEMRIT